MVLSVNQFYKSIFHKKTYKLSLDAGCTCPNRDGTCGIGGCIFCGAAGAGEFTASRLSSDKNQIQSISDQIEEAKSIVGKKIGSEGAVYIAYFQSFTNTYGETDLLFDLWDKALSCKDVVGIAIATRPDCLSNECLEKLAFLADKYFVQVELGLQTANDVIANQINRGYKTTVYQEAVAKLHLASKKIHVVTHVIFGLPNESHDSMMETVKLAVSSKSDGIKITSLYVLRDTVLQEIYEKGDYTPLTEDEYFFLLKDALLLIPENIVIHRLSGDPPKRLLIAPQWPCNKKRILNKLKKLISSY